MKKRTVLFYGLYILSVTLAFAGFWSFKTKWLSLLFILYSILRAVFRKRAEKSFLVLSTGFAIAGLLLGTQPSWMFLYMASTLICFDLTEMELKTSGSREDPELAYYRRLRIYPMTAVILTALVGILLLFSLSIRLPFIALLGLTLTAFFFVNRIIHLLKKK